jgi:hypothetical protein
LRSAFSVSCVRRNVRVASLVAADREDRYGSSTYVEAWGWFRRLLLQLRTSASLQRQVVAELCPLLIGSRTFRARAVTPASGQLRTLASQKQTLGSPFIITRTCRRAYWQLNANQLSSGNDAKSLDSRT